MAFGVYKKLLDSLPAGVFAFDAKMRVFYTNAPFRRAFSSLAKGKGTLKEVVGCTAEGACETCAGCALQDAMRSAIQDGAEKNASVTVDVPHENRKEKLTIRIRIIPADQKKKIFLGLTDGSYQTELARDMISAKQMQRKLLPAGKSMGGIPYSYMYVPCLEVGGDLLDVYGLDGETYGVVFDVSGKGVSAGMLSTFAKAGYDRTEKSLASAITALREKFLARNLDESLYVTAAAVRVNAEEKKIRYLTAGHNAPVLLKNAYGINEIEMAAPPVSRWSTDFLYEEKEIGFEKGDILVLLPDGVTECSNSAGEQFGIERAESVLHQSKNGEDFIGKLKTALSVFSGGKLSDDVTAIAFDL